MGHIARTYSKLSFYTFSHSLPFDFVQTRSRREKEELLLLLFCKVYFILPLFAPTELIEGGHRITHGSPRKPKDIIAKSFPYLYCSRKFHSSQALAGHQNAYALIPSTSPPLLVFSSNCPIGIFNPSPYTNAHGVSLFQLKSPLMGSNGAPKFENIVLSQGKLSSEICQKHADDQKSTIIWERSMIFNDFEHGYTEMGMDKGHRNGDYDHRHRNQKLDLTFHL